MEQGQLGRWPPGDELRATRRFLTDAVVFEDSTLHEGRGSPTGPSARALTRRPVPHCRRTWPAWPGALRPPRGPWCAPRSWWAMPRWLPLSVAGHTATRLARGPGRDGRAVSAPDGWTPDRGHGHTAARLTRGAPPTAAPRRRRTTADGTGDSGSGRPAAVGIDHARSSCSAAAPSCPGGDHTAPRPTCPSAAARAGRHRRDGMSRRQRGL